MLIVTYGLGCGLGVGMVYGTIVSNAVKFFPDKGGLAGGLTTACYGGSSVLMPAIVTLLLNQYHITTVFKIVGAVMTAVICASAFVIEACPAGFTVEGAGGGASQTQGKDYSWREMLKMPVFYLMLLTLTCGAFAGMMIISQASPIAQKMMGFTPGAAAAVVSVLALFNMLGRLVSGSVSDKIGPANTLKLTFLCSLAGSVLLCFCHEGSNALFYLGLVIIGFCFGSIMGIYPGFTARQFGRKNNSVNYGIMFIGFALAGLLGPMLMNTVVSATGRYQPAFIACAVLAAVGEVLINLFTRTAEKG
jgi:MFS family permease